VSISAHRSLPWMLVILIAGVVEASVQTGGLRQAAAMTASRAAVPAGVTFGWWAEGRSSVQQGNPTVRSEFPPNWIAESDQPLASFGSSVAGAGDVNGDGYNDVIVGSFFFDNGQSEEGRAFVFHGSAAGLGTTPAWTAESDHASAFFGISVAGAGDINGDGYDDVVVGATGYDNGQYHEGRAYVYHGSAAGLSLTPDWTAESNQVGADFGQSVGGAGDVNGDGFYDVIVGAPGYSNGQFDEGRAYVYHGSAGGLSTTANWTAEPDKQSAYFGVSVAGGGDVNGDGYDEVIVGAHAFGWAFAYHGSAAGLSISPDWKAKSNQAGALFGDSVAVAVDVNGDGYDDVIVGAPSHTHGEFDEGRAFAYHGSAAGLNTSPDWTAESNKTDAFFGEDVAGAGDVNGDGYDDIIVGAPHYADGRPDQGRTSVFCGSEPGLGISPCRRRVSNQAYAWFGYSVAGAGDVNGDGYGDVIVGALYYDHGESDEGVAVAKYGRPD
jgi:hypothetical protein